MRCSKVRCALRPSGKQFIGVTSFCGRGVGLGGGHSELLFSSSSFVTANINAFHTVTNNEKR